MGIGKIPDAVLRCLRNHSDLGIHTEMFSDGVVDLVREGVVTGRKKTLLPGKIVTSFLMGTKRLYEWAHDNPAVEMRPSDFTNDPFTIARNDSMVATNSALAVDLTGQVAADSVGGRFFSGIGGQVDFITSSLLMSRLSAETERFIADDEDLTSMAKVLNGWMRSLVGDEGLYVTLFAAIIDFDTRTLSYINCGHPAQLFWSNTNQQRIALDSGNMPVGLFGDEKFGDVRERRFDVGSGDKLMLVADGMQELWSERDSGEEDWIRVFDRFNRESHGGNRTGNTSAIHVATGTEPGRRRALRPRQFEGNVDRGASMQASPEAMRRKLSLLDARTGSRCGRDAWSIRAEIPRSISALAPSSFAQLCSSEMLNRAHAGSPRALPRR